MRRTRFSKFLKGENYIHCSVCANYRNMNSFAHRKSAAHQTSLAAKLQKIVLHLSEEKEKPAIIHDAHWPEKEFKRFCHFCGCQYAVHHVEDEFVVESLGCLYHFADSQHLQSAKFFLNLNFREEKASKYCLSSEELEIYLAKVSDAKQKYLKKMDIINALAQIKAAEQERKKLLNSEIQLEQALSAENLSRVHEGSRNEFQTTVNKDLNKIPPWLEDIPSQSSESASSSVIGPTMDTLKKHVVSQKKKGLFKNRVGANFKHHTQSSPKWLPSFQGVWNKGHRKQVKVQFNRRNMTK